MSLVNSEALFCAARARTGRDALRLYKASLGIAPDDEEGNKRAEEQFRALPLLLDPELREFCLRALGEARGPSVDEDIRFPSTIWVGGATHISDGHSFKGSIGEFVGMLHARARAIAPKQRGWVLEPTTTSIGRRVNADTKALHALFLDCDGSGEWTPLLTALGELDLAHVAYQSGGWSQTTPKWRVVLPLAKPFPTDSEAGQEAWKGFYRHARVVFGSVGALLGVGFDAATDTPCCPWFLTEKRAPSDPERRVVWRAGRALDAVGLLLALPEIPDEDARSENEPRAVTSTDLEDEQREKIVEALSAATARVSSNRRDLYLSLPGVLLDRGVPPDDVLEIIKEVSASYPRSHPDKHADNVHCAQTTINCWIGGRPVTRIGTLNTILPEIARAVDAVLPDPSRESLNAALLEILAEPQRRAAAAAVATLVGAAAPVSETASPTAKRKRRAKLDALGREIAPLIADLKKSKKSERQIEGFLFEKILDGACFGAADTSPEQLDGLANKAMHALGYHLPPDTTWKKVLDFAGRSLDFTRPKEVVVQWERSFYEGQGSRKRRKAKNDKKFLEETERTRSFFNELEQREKGIR